MIGVHYSKLIYNKKFANKGVRITDKISEVTCKKCLKAIKTMQERLKSA